LLSEIDAIFKILKVKMNYIAAFCQVKKSNSILQGLVH
jgi:hypothetical protein